MTFSYGQPRQGMTVLPAQIDEATGQVIEGSEELVGNHLTNIALQEREGLEDSLEEEPPTPAVIENESDLTEDDVDPVELADISEELMEAEVIASDEHAEQIMSVDFGDDDASLAVQYLAHQVYSGAMTTEEAFSEALNSGISHRDLINRFQRMQQHFSN